MKSINYDIDLECLFFREYFFSVSVPATWVAHSFPVLAMTTSGTGKLVLDDETEALPLLHQPLFLAANLKRKPYVESSNGLKTLAFAFRLKLSNGIDLSRFLKIPMFFEEKITRRLRELMLELYSLQAIENKNWLKSVTTKKRIYYEILENIISSASDNDGRILTFIENFNCSAAVKYLNNNFMCPLNIPKLMKLCNLSRTHFFRQFKKQTNVTPFEYIKNRRLQESQKMLLCTNLSISEIGDHVGWPDQFHFSRIFKKETGLSPKKYRHQFKKCNIEAFQR